MAVVGGVRLVLILYFFFATYFSVHSFIFTSFEHRRESTLHGPVDSMVLCSNLIIKTTNNNNMKKVISFTLSRTIDVAHDEEKEEIP